MVGNKKVQRAKYIPTGANNRNKQVFSLMQLSVTETKENKQQWVVNSLWKCKGGTITWFLKLHVRTTCEVMWQIRWQTTKPSATIRDFWALTGQTAFKIKTQRIGGVHGDAGPTLHPVTSPKPLFWTQHLCFALHVPPHCAAPAGFAETCWLRFQIVTH